MRRTRRLAGLLSAGALALGLVLGTGGAAQAAVTPPSGGWAELFNPLLPLVGDQYHVCLDVPGGTTAPNALLQMYHCHGYASNGAPQRWVFTHLSDDSYWIWNQSNLLCVTAMPAVGDSTRGLIRQFPCNSRDGQAWRFVDFQPDLNFQLVNNSPNFANQCLVATGNRNNAVMRWETCTNSAFQIWALG